jgi:hypothetical protein
MSPWSGYDDDMPPHAATGFAVDRLVRELASDPSWDWVDSDAGRRRIARAVIQTRQAIQDGRLREVRP